MLIVVIAILKAFQLTAARRRLVKYKNFILYTHRFNSQPPEGGWPAHFRQALAPSRFNSQPPEGGWSGFFALPIKDWRFNSQPPEGGWLLWQYPHHHQAGVSTHSRPKAAGLAQNTANECEDVSTHSRPKAAGCAGHDVSVYNGVSTHSRPKAAGRHAGGRRRACGGFNSQPPEGGWLT